MAFGRKPKEEPIDWKQVGEKAKKFEKEGEEFARKNGLTGRKPKPSGS